MYKNRAIIFIVGVACGFIGFWLVGILLTPNPSVSDNQSAAGATDIPISSSTSQDEHSIDQTVTVNLTPQPTPTRTELLAYQMILRSERNLNAAQMEYTQQFYEEMLPHVARVCDDMDGMSDVVDWMVRTHESILDLGVSAPDDIIDVSRNIYSILVELEPKIQGEGDRECEVLTRVYIELRRQGDSKGTATNKMLEFIREHQ